MRLIDKVLNFFCWYIGIVCFLGSLTSVGLAVWMAVDQTEPVSMAQRIGSVALALLFALLAFWGGKKILGLRRELQGAACRRRQQMLRNPGRIRWKKYARRYARGDQKTLEEALQIVWNTNNLEEFRIALRTAQECLQIFELAKAAGVRVELNYNLRALENDKPTMINEVLFRAVCEALREKDRAGTPQERQQWIDWIRSGVQAFYREQSLYIDAAMFARAMGLIDSSGRSI